eukprot:s4027_g5.t1
MALQATAIEGPIKENIEALLRDEKLHALYGGIMDSYKSEKGKEKSYEALTSLMVEASHHSAETILKLLERHFSPLAKEGGLNGDPRFERVAYEPTKRPFRKGPGRNQRPLEGKLLGVVGTTQVREIFTGWEAADGGVYVGDGIEMFPTSIFRESYAGNIAIDEAGKVLDGRPLYVDAKAFHTAADVVDKFSIDGRKKVWTWSQCQSFMREHLRDEVSVSFTGVVLKVPIELLPISLPEDGQTELRLLKLLSNEDGPRTLSADERRLAMVLAKECGKESWLGLVLAVLNSMFCGGSRPLGKVMPHPKTRTPDQEQVVSHVRSMIQLWVEEDAHPITPSGWEAQSQALGDFYTGYEVTKAYKLSWSSIAPHVPGPGEAGRVKLEDTVAPELKDFVVDPDLLRIPDDELGEVQYSAPVLVESSAEYDLIVKHLVSAGMLEREVPSDTVRVHDTPVYNGMFGVHKGWIDLGEGQWQRTLRLIINLIPTNLLQRRMPVQASKSMGYAPMWGSMVLLENEMIVAYVEDVRHCFHIFAPGPRWRGYFAFYQQHLFWG